MVPRDLSWGRGGGARADGRWRVGVPGCSLAGGPKPPCPPALGPEAGSRGKTPPCELPCSAWGRLGAPDSPWICGDHVPFSSLVGRGMPRSRRHGSVSFSS